MPARADELPEGLSASGSVRLRYEAIDGQARSGFNSADQLLNLRTQLLLTLRHHNLRLVTEIHDSRVWNADPGTPLTTNEVNAIEPVQAYLQADLGGILGPGTATSVRAGRFTLDLGSRRLVAADDYRNTTNGFTGLRGDIQSTSGIKATAIYVLPLTRLPDDGPSLRNNHIALDKESFASVLWGGFVARQAKGHPLLVEASFLHFGERDAPGRPTRDRSLNSLGGRIVVDPRPGHVDWGVEGIYQWGRISASAAAGAATLPVDANFLRALVGYSVAAPWKPRLLVEVDRASGGAGPSYHRFDPLFGMRRADLGPAGLYNAIGRSNVLSPGVRLEVTPSARFDAFIGYRALWLADRRDAFSTTGVRDPSGASGRFAGQQIDLRMRYWLLPKRLRFEADGVLLAKGRFLRDAPNANAATATRYVCFNLTATF
ncbi:alginate export family protein [Sphingomonas sp. RT2P30]|uniref:alginate export family protein n=1 Tax=Parasphingomonas halimpatiens TaxID=3096162 RepID=UPI002FCCA2B2